MARSSQDFEEFFVETSARLFGGLCLVTGSRYEAEEIAQEAYARVWERWDDVYAFAPGSDPEAVASARHGASVFYGVLGLLLVVSFVLIVRRRAKT